MLKGKIRAILRIEEICKEMEIARENIRKIKSLSNRTNTTREREKRVNKRWKVTPKIMEQNFPELKMSISGEKKQLCEMLKL